MIMQENTPRSLTWPGCLAVVALGLAVLPMLPSLHGEPPSKDEAGKEIQEAEKALEKAKVALEHQKIELKMKLKEHVKAEQQLATESARKALDRQRTVPFQPPMVVEDTEKAAYRIEIELSAEDSEKASDVNDLVEEIRKVLPAKSRNKVVLRPVPVYTMIQITPQPNRAAPPSPPPPRVPQPSTNLPAAPRLPQPGRMVTRLAVPPASPNAPASKSSEKRINDLEKKLEKVLRELQELRKQMKPPRGGTAAPGAVPADGAYAPPERPIPYPVPAPGTVAPPAPAAPAPPSATPAPPSDPSARRLPNPYGEHRSVC